MKTIKIGFSGVWKEFDPDKFCLIELLKRHYDVQICDDPDYIICSSFGFYDYIECPQIRIFFSSENYTPDFNYVDYAISFYPIEFLDRHYSFPCLVDTLDVFWKLQKQDRNYPDTILEEKTYFASMIASHDSEYGIRSEMFRILSEYKRVESLGYLLYNMPNGEKVSREDGSKTAFLRKCKFTLCCESLNHTGFITEKILEAFASDTIPIYYGSSTVTDIINKDAFINLADFDTLQDALERIRELDSDDEQYMRMLRQPVFVDPDFIANKVEGLDAFLCHIFDQPLERAQRRCNLYMPKVYENWLLYGRRFVTARNQRNEKWARLEQRYNEIIDPIIEWLKKTGNRFLGEQTMALLRSFVKRMLKK